MAETTHKATPKKLKDDTWGAWVNAPNVKANDRLTIVTSTGKTWDCRVDSVLWHGKNREGKPAAVVTTRKLDAAPGPARPDDDVPF